MLIAKDELEKLLNAGKTYEEIAEILDISYSCVRNTVIKHFPDKAKKAKRLSETEKKEILRLYETGMKKIDIARQIGVNGSSVSRCIAKVYPAPSREYVVMENINPNGLNPKILRLKKSMKIGDKIKINDSMATVLQKYKYHFLIVNKYGFKECFTYARIALIGCKK